MTSLPAVSDPAHNPFSHTGSGELCRIGVAVCHGFTGSPASMREWAQHLADAGFSVELPLLPGHGTSWQDLATRRWQEWYQAFDAAYQDLASRCDYVFVVGLSMGGCLALRAAALRPVSGVVLVNPGLVIDDWRAPLTGFLKHIVKSTPPISNDIVKSGVDERAYSRTPVAAAHELGKLFANTRDLLPQITAPVQVYRSTTDHVVSESSMVALRSGLTGAPLEVIPLLNSYHVATMDNDAPVIFNGSVEFIRRVSRSTMGSSTTAESADDKV
ncbi:alpha/beta hydrolase [Pseudarthrobacter sp. J1738]|uniref:alpha/beta hydrolase n=1 Tax=unclassified Pseudarthrobacter TaxID=2647000 RepID=UPI003D2D7AF2